jgi:AcrR family transcriptional regulator
MTRAEMQEHNRRKVIAAARVEFLAKGFRDAKIDDIAERAELTRGAVYSNFTSKRALYLTVLLPALEAPASVTTAPRSVAAALAAFARAWTARLALVSDAPRLDAELLPEVLVARSLHLPFAQLTGVAALTLGLVLEQMEDGRDRMVRTAEAALTTLHGASQLAAAAPHFVDPFAVVAAVAHLAHLDLGDGWPPPHLPFTPPATPCDDPWTPPPATDALRDTPAPLASDGIVAVLGLHRLTAIEEALRGPLDPVVPDDDSGGGPALTRGMRSTVPPPANSGTTTPAPDTEAAGVVTPDAGSKAVTPDNDPRAVTPDTGSRAVTPDAGSRAVTPDAGSRAVTPDAGAEPVTLVIVTADPGEFGPLARLCIADLAACLRATVPPSDLPRLRIVHDESGEIAAAAGVDSPADGTEIALRIVGGRVIARATGYGACHAVATYH